jgi:hypothetical protein
MLKIEKNCDGSATRLRLIGRIESDLIASIRSAIAAGTEFWIWSKSPWWILE